MSKDFTVTHNDNVTSAPRWGWLGGGVQPQFSAELPPHSVVTAALVEAAAQSPVSVADQSLVAAV